VEAAENEANFWHTLFWQRDTSHGPVGLVSDSTKAEELARSWGMKDVQLDRHGWLTVFSFKSPAIVRADTFNTRGSRRYSLTATDDGVTFDRRRKPLGADFRAFAGVSAASNYDSFAPAVAGEVGVGIDRGPWGLELGYSQPTFPVRKGKAFAKLTVNWR
jgi:hypothetical protein